MVALVVKTPWRGPVPGGRVMVSISSKARPSRCMMRSRSAPRSGMTRYWPLGSRMAWCGCEAVCADSGPEAVRV